MQYWPTRCQIVQRDQLDLLLKHCHRQYSQIEKEDWLCVFGVTRFHAYLLGQYFTLIMDHKPLLSLLSVHKAVPIHASACIQRWALTLAAYE